jgi:putative Ca2+/H+ antiporter (TMEM165/GDT1 family)
VRGADRIADTYQIVVGLLCCSWSLITELFMALCAAGLIYFGASIMPEAARQTIGGLGFIVIGIFLLWKAKDRQRKRRKDKGS